VHLILFSSVTIRRTTLYSLADSKGSDDSASIPTQVTKQAEQEKLSADSGNSSQLEGFVIDN
jgi:hypothetical protein